MLLMVVSLFSNGCIIGGNGAPFPFAHYASPSPTAFYDVDFNLPLWYDLLFMSGFFI
jgi:hypothetical protein